MTAYIVITDLETDPEAPLTSELAKKWRDNPIAMFEGATGATRLSIGALQRLNPGVAIRSRDDAVKSSVSPSLNDMTSFSFMQAGTIRVAFEHRSTPGATGVAAIVRRRNGTETTLASFTNTTTFVARTVDCSVEPGDIIIGRVSGSASNSGQIQNYRLQTNGEDLWPGVEARLEGNTYNS